jgi:hypothetical protein
MRVEVAAIEPEQHRDMRARRMPRREQQPRIAAEGVGVARGPGHGRSAVLDESGEGHLRV